MFYGGEYGVWNMIPPISLYAMKYLSIHQRKLNSFMCPMILLFNIRRSLLRTPKMSLICVEMS